MRKFLVLVVFIFSCSFLFAVDINSIAPGALDNVSGLLNKPAMVKPAVATALGKNWYTLETDCHVFTDLVSFKQVVDVLKDIENQQKYFNGKKSKLQISNIVRSGDEITADFVSIAIAVGIQLKTPYKAITKVTINTDTRFAVNITQSDSASNKNMQNMQAPRYVEEVTVGGKKYVYIRMYAIEDINASILLGAKGTLEKNSFPTNEEAMNMLIAAAKTK